MKVGERFNPHRVFPSGTWFPDSILLSTKLQPTDKLVLGRLMRAAGVNGWCWPSQRTIASWVGLTVKQVRLALGRMVSAGVIEIEHKTGGASGYYFRWHEVFNHETLPPEGQPLPPQPCPPEGQTPCPPEGRQSALSGQQGSVERSVERSVPATQRDLPLKPVRSETAEECPQCDGTGWRERAMGGVSAVERCSTCRRGVIQKKPPEKASVDWRQPRFLSSKEKGRGGG